MTNIDNYLTTIGVFSFILILLLISIIYYIYTYKPYIIYPGRYSMEEITMKSRDKDIEREYQLKLLTDLSLLPNNIREELASAKIYTTILSNRLKTIEIYDMDNVEVKIETDDQNYGIMIISVPSLEIQSYELVLEKEVRLRKGEYIILFYGNSLKSGKVSIREDKENAV